MESEQEQSIKIQEKNIEMETSINEEENTKTETLIKGGENIETETLTKEEENNKTETLTKEEENKTETLTKEEENKTETLTKEEENKTETLTKEEENKTETLTKEEENIETETLTKEEEISDNLNPYAYIKRDGFTSEIFKIELRGLPKFYGIVQLKKLLNKKLNLGSSKIKRPKNNSPFIYVCFRSEKDKENAIKVLDGFQWKNSKLSAQEFSTSNYKNQDYFFI